MACSGECSKCNKCRDDCSCYKPYTIDSKNVIYNSSENCSTSKLLCFLGVNNNTPLNLILERIDSKLCLLNNFNPEICARNILGLPISTDIHTVVQKLLNYVCLAQDTKVKISTLDNSSGYLEDKLIVGDCLIKTIVSDILGNQSIKIELDFDCIKNNLPICLEINCNNCNPLTCVNPTFGTPVVICEGTNTIVTVSVSSPSGVLIQFSSDEGITWVDGNPNHYTFIFESTGFLQKIKARMAGCSIYTDGYVQLCAAPPVAPCIPLTSCSFS